MEESVLTKLNKKTSVLLLYKRGEDGSFLENVDVIVLKDGVVQIKYNTKDEIITTHISNVVITTAR